MAISPSISDVVFTDTSTIGLGGDCGSSRVFSDPSIRGWIGTVPSIRGWIPFHVPPHLPLHAPLHVPLLREVDARDRAETPCGVPWMVIWSVETRSVKTPSYAPPPSESPSAKPPGSLHWKASHEVGEVEVPQSQTAPPKPSPLRETHSGASTVTTLIPLPVTTSVTRPVSGVCRTPHQTSQVWESSHYQL